jgi:branched-chain amino acid transport system permease protein
MTDLAQLLIAGIAQGAAYGLVAASFVVVFAVTGVLSLAQGQFAAIAAFVAVSVVDAGAPMPLAAVAGLAVTVGLGWAAERGVVGGIYRSAPVTQLVVTLGLLMALQGVTLLVWGPDARTLPPVRDGAFSVGDVVIRWQHLVIVGTAAIVGLALWLFLRRTTVGRALTACAEQPAAARLVGVPQRRMYRLSFCLAAGLAGLAGLVISPVFATTWDTGLTLGLKGFVAASLVGLVSLPGAVLAGVLLGVVESLAAGYLDTATKEAVAYLLLLTLLALRPGGLRRAHAVRV